MSDNPMEFEPGSFDADETFDVDMTKMSSPSSKEQKDNAFAGIEEKLGLPIGSTKAGIKDIKDEMKSIQSDVKTLKTTGQIIEKKEQLANIVPAGSFSIDDLANDRAKLRDSYMRLLDRGMDMLNRIQEQLDNLVNPEPDDYAAWQKQYLACLKTLDSIKGALVTLRQEEELKNIRMSSGSDQTAQNQSDGQASGVSDPDAVSGAIEVTSQQSNAWIKSWTAELDKQIKQEIEADHSSRLAEKAVEAIEHESK